MRAYSMDLRERALLDSDVSTCAAPAPASAPDLAVPFAVERTRGDHGPDRGRQLRIRLGRLGSALVATGVGRARRFRCA